MRLALLALGSIMSITALAQVHVAPGGSDTADGSEARPVATLARAVALAGETKAKHIRIASGTYFNTGVTLTAAHEGITIEGPADRSAVLVGGVPLSNWQREGELLVSAAPEKADFVRLLIVNGQMAERARFPESGHLTHESVFDVRWMSTTGGGWQRKPTDEELLTMKFAEGDLPAAFVAQNAEVTVYHMWDESCVPVKEIDRATRTLRFTEKLGHPAGAFGVKRYVVWNTAEGLTRAGQFYHDRAGKRLVYRPRQGETPETIKAIVGTHERVIHLRGEEGKPLTGVTLKNLTIEASTVPSGSGGFGALRYPGAVQLTRADGATLEGLLVRNVAGQGIDSTWAKVTGVTISNCEVAHCGAGGITVGGTNVTIRGNHVHDVGRLYPSALGIARGGTDCIVENNEVHDCTYSAINYGGTRNQIRRNLIYRAITQLYDGAAIYSFAAKDCVIEENVCRDIGGKGGYARAGYYLDEQSEGSVVRRNLAINVDVPLHNHMSKNCTLEDNVLVNEGDLSISSARCEGFTARRNVVYAGGKLSVTNVNAYSTWSDNVLFSTSGTYERTVTQEYSAKQREALAPEGSIVADPQFVNLAQRDFRYREGSPAKERKLAELSLDMAGRK